MSIILPCYLLPQNDRALLNHTKRFVNSLREHASPCELVIIDNGSPEDRDYLIAQADLYIRNPENRGFAVAVNQGLRLAHGYWLVVANNDVVLLDDWPATAKRAFHDFPVAGAVSAFLHGLDPQHRRQPQTVGFRAMFGALWLTTRDVVDKVGYLDEAYSLGREDRDYWVRMLEIDLHLVRAGWCLHVGNATWGKIPDHRKKYRESVAHFNSKWPAYAYK